MAPARNGDLKSMSLVHIVTSTLVNDSFFGQAFFVSTIQILQFAHQLFSYTRQFHIYKKGPQQP